MVKETIIARGHPNVLGTHKTTIEITKENFLTKKGDCIIGISADKSCADLSDELKKALRSNFKFKVTFRVGELEDSVIGYGSPELKLTNKNSIVIRKSSYIDDRTLLVKADKAAHYLNKELIKKMQAVNARIEIIIE